MRRWESWELHFYIWDELSEKWQKTLPSYFVQGYDQKSVRRHGADILKDLGFISTESKWRNVGEEHHRKVELFLQSYNKYEARLVKQ